MLQIGFMARLQITHGAEDTREMRKAVCELRIQAYNSKLKTPAGKTTSFKHTDCDWTRPGTDTPAPQSVAFTSPSMVAGQKTFSFRFFDLDTPDRRQRIQEEIIEGGRQKRSYDFPRRPGQKGSAGKATDTPAWADFDQLGTTLPPVMGDELLFFTQMTGHEVRQYKINLTREQRKGEEEVPLEFTRTCAPPMPAHRPPRTRAPPTPAHAHHVVALHFVTAAQG